MNVFVSDLKYITVSELKASSPILDALEDEAVQILWVKAENVVDSLCKLTETNDSIKKALVLLTECISKWEVANRVVTSEKRRWNSVTYSVKQNRYENIHYCMNEEIYLYLKPYLKGGFLKQVI